MRVDRAVGLALGAVVMAGWPAGAQEAPRGWSFALSPYVWLPGLSTSVETTRGTVDVETSTRDAISQLDFAFMGAAEARHGRWGLILDLIYADLSSSADTPLRRLWSSAELDTRLTAFTAYAGYRVLENDRAFVDLLGGGRFYWLDLELSLEPGRLPGRSRDFSDDWADPVVGARARYDFNDAWFATALADYGGFGGSSDESWQAFASVGYQFDPRWSVQAGWRYMAVEKEITGRDVEIDLSGPILGFTVRF
jgi:hypothetical protein